MSDAEDPVAILTKLVNKSLVVWDPDAARYRLLETIRAFARSRLSDGGEADLAEARHLAWCARVADSFGDQARHSGRREATTCSTRLDNFRVALAWAASHSAPDGPRLAGAVEQAVVAPTTEAVWELVARPDRSYYDRMDAESVEFPHLTAERRFTLSGDDVTIGRRSSSRGINPGIDLSAPSSPTPASRTNTPFWCGSPTAAGPSSIRAPPTVSISTTAPERRRSTRSGR